MPHSDFILLIYMDSHDLLHGFNVLFIIKGPKLAFSSFRSFLIDYCHVGPFLLKRQILSKKIAVLKQNFVLKFLHLKKCNFKLKSKMFSLVRL